MAKNKPKSHSDKGEKCKSKITASNYRKNCSNPMAMPNGMTPWPNQIHHILCEHAVLDIQPSNDADGKKLAYINECLCIADWNINDSTNLIGLPLKPAYIKSRGTDPQNLPCHEVDHNTSNGYTFECKQWLHNNVWNTLIDRRKAHETSAEDIIAALKKCTSLYKSIITKRGNRGPGRCGTEICWKKRFEKKYEYEWYKPFSMSSDPSHRSPGGRWLPDIFEKIS